MVIGEIAAKESGPMIGETLSGKYEIRQLLGSGSMTSVYLARDAQQGRMVAVKVLLPHFAADLDVVERFLERARQSIQLKHKHIVQVLQVNRDEWLEAPYLVMELLRGRTIEDALTKTGPFATHEAVRLMDQILSALSAAHAKGVVHADVRPGHAFLYAAVGGPESVKLFDFGLSRVLEPDRSLGRGDERTPMTPHALSPEWLADGGKIDSRTDIFGCGAMLHLMITGKLPLDAQTMPDLVRAISSGDLARTLSPLPGLTAELAGVVATAIDKDPDRRYQTAEDMMKAMASVADAGRPLPPPQAVRQSGPPEPPAPAAPPRPAKVAAPPPPGKPAASRRPSRPPDRPTAKQYTGADLVSWDDEAPQEEKPAAAPGRELDETPTGIRGLVPKMPDQAPELELAKLALAASAPTLPPPASRSQRRTPSTPPAPGMGKADDWPLMPLPEIEPPSIEEIEASSTVRDAVVPRDAGEAVEAEEEIEEVEEVEEIDELVEVDAAQEPASIEPVSLRDSPASDWGEEAPRASASTAIDIYLEAVDGPCRGTICPVSEDGVVVGRAKEADISVMDPVVSRRHARFYLEGGAVMVKDLGSSFGTWVNGEKVDSARIAHGDKVAVGASVFVVNYPGKV